MVKCEFIKARLLGWPGLRAAVTNRNDAAGVRLLQNVHVDTEATEHDINDKAAA